jgi:hypothetical protein
MKVLYRGFEIDCHREKCMAGYQLLYFTVYRKSDGYELICDYTGGSDTVRDYVGYMKNRVDGFIEDPSNEELQTWIGSDEKRYSDKEYARLIASHRRENAKTEREHAR